MSKEMTDMKKRMEEKPGLARGEAEGARRATGASPRAAVGSLGPGQRWSLRRKREVVLRLLRGESVDALSRELGVEIYRLEAWQEQALASLDAGLRRRKDPREQGELDAAMKRIGELSMENELLRVRCEAKGPLGRRRSKP